MADTPTPPDTTGITQDGGVTRYTPEVDAAAQESLNASGTPTPTPEELDAAAKARGFADAAELAAFEEFKAHKAKPAEEGAAPEGEPAKETEKKDGDKPADLTEDQQALVTASLEGVAPEMAEKAKPFVEAAVRNGTLTDAEVAEAAKATGLSEAMVRQYMRGGDPEVVAFEQARAEKPFLDLAGGTRESWDEFAGWGRQALNPADIAALDQALAEGRVADVAPYIERWKAAGGGASPADLTAGQTAAGTAGAAPNTDVFTSMADQAKAQADPRYKADPAFRQAVFDKIARSSGY